MTAPSTELAAPAGVATGVADSSPSVRRGIVTMVVSGMSSQVGAAAGAHAFSAIGPAGVVAVRQLVAAVVLMPVARPPVRRMTWAQWWPTLLLAAVFACMNLSLYTAIDRIGLGLAVTLEFLGPLAVAVGSSRTRGHLLTAVAAALGVYVLVLPGPTSDHVGIGLALLAAGCWAGYIHLNRLLGTRLPGLQAPAVATTISAVVYLPVLLSLVAQGRMTGLPLLYALIAGVLSSVIPYAADLTALRHVPARFFGVFMSLHPVWAAVAGLVLLGQVLALHEWLGVAIIVAANAATVLTARPRRGADARAPETPTGPRTAHMSARCPAGPPHDTHVGAGGTWTAAPTPPGSAAARGCPPAGRRVPRGGSGPSR